MLTDEEHEIYREMVSVRARFWPYTGKVLADILPLFKARSASVSLHKSKHTRYLIELGVIGRHFATRYILTELGWRLREHHKEIMEILGC